MVPMIGWLIGAAWLWFCIVLVTGRHDYNWKEMLLWVALAGLVGLGVNIPFLGADPGVKLIARGVGEFAKAVVIYLVLEFRFQIDGMARKGAIVGLYFGVSVAIVTLLALLGKSGSPPG